MSQHNTFSISACPFFVLGVGYGTSYADILKKGEDIKKKLLAGKKNNARQFEVTAIDEAVCILTQPKLRGPYVNSLMRTGGDVAEALKAVGEVYGPMIVNENQENMLVQKENAFPNRVTITAKRRSVGLRTAKSNKRQIDENEGDGHQGKKLKAFCRQGMQSNGNVQLPEVYIDGKKKIVGTRKKTGRASVKMYVNRCQFESMQSLMMNMRDDPEIPVKYKQEINYLLRTHDM